MMAELFHPLAEFPRPYDVIAAEKEVPTRNRHYTELVQALNVAISHDTTRALMNSSPRACSDHLTRIPTP
jgi:hypothetical protein